jgi:hypothetical protein
MDKRQRYDSMCQRKKIWHLLRILRNVSPGSSTAIYNSSEHMKIAIVWLRSECAQCNRLMRYGFWVHFRSWHVCLEQEGENDLSDGEQPPIEAFINSFKCVIPCNADYMLSSMHVAISIRTFFASWAKIVCLMFFFWADWCFCFVGCVYALATQKLSLAVLDWCICGSATVKRAVTTRRVRELINGFTVLLY